MKRLLPKLIFSLYCLLIYHAPHLAAQDLPASFGKESFGKESFRKESFRKEKTPWHEGFDRYDFLMDTATMIIEPIKAPEGEKFGVGEPAKGRRRCVLIVPKKAAPGNPWSWRGCYWDYEPQTEIELLRRGFYIAYISASATLKPGPEWEAWYTFLTVKHGLSAKPAFVGMSRGGEYAYIWATTHPDKVACIYADNPGMNRTTLMKLDELAAKDIPLLHVCGSIDPILGDNALFIEALYQQLGGRISTMIKDGSAHHPHGLPDPRPIADWIEQNSQPVTDNTPPAFAGTTFSKKALLENLAPLIRAGLPLLQVSGSLDPAWKDNGLLLAQRYKRLGGKSQLILQSGKGHYPLAPEDPAAVAKLIARWPKLMAR